nr:unnamed protein product [Callosobruchus chinensis]
MCQVNTDPMKMQAAFLEVVIPPDIIYEETSGDMMVPEGGSAKLICRARGFPKPRIVWRREDGAQIIVRTAPDKVERLNSVEGEVLTLMKVTRSEMGAYLCIAANGVPPTVSKRMMLHVHFHPLIQVRNQLVGAPVNTDVTLQCHVEASPKAINYWTRESGKPGEHMREVATDPSRTTLVALCPLTTFTPPTDTYTHSQCTYKCAVPKASDRAVY